jgi:response regulator NasT
MSRPLHVAVADDEVVMQEYYRQTLPDLGHVVAFAGSTGQALIDHCRATRPDLVITDIKMSDMDGIRAAEEICRQAPVPIILVSAYHDPDLIERAREEHILAYLVKPITRGNLETAIGIALQRFEQFQALHKEATDLRQALDDRKVIERAKGILMQRLKLDEPDAFRRLQKLAMDKNLKLIEVSRMVLTAEELLQPPDGETTKAPHPTRSR